MKIYRGFEETDKIKNPVVTTGSFDGVHIGHKTILNRLKMLADRNNGESVLITFDPHPRKVLYPDTAGKDLKLINSPEEKFYLLRKAGLDNIIIVNFTLDFSRITSEVFVRDYLHGILKAKVIVAGFNHHFGFNQEGDYRQLWGWREKYNFEAEEIPQQEVQHETVSSTKIRQAIREGNIQRANAYLDHYYIIIGTLTGYQYQSGLGMPDFFRIPPGDESKLLPAAGIYAVSVENEGMIKKAMAIINESNAEGPEILVSFLEMSDIPLNKKVIILFHKKNHGAIDLSDHKSQAKLKHALEEISELIY